MLRLLAWPWRALYLVVDVVVVIAAALLEGVVEGIVESVKGDRRTDGEREVPPPPPSEAETFFERHAWMTRSVSVPLTAALGCALLALAAIATGSWWSQHLSRSADVAQRGEAVTLLARLHRVDIGGWPMGTARRRLLELALDDESAPTRRQALDALIEADAYQWPRLPWALVDVLDQRGWSEDVLSRVVESLVVLEARPDGSDAFLPLARAMTNGDHEDPSPGAAAIVAAGLPADSAFRLLIHADPAVFRCASALARSACTPQVLEATMGAIAHYEQRSTSGEVAPASPRRSATRLSGEVSRSESVYRRRALIDRLLQATTEEALRASDTFRWQRATDAATVRALDDYLERCPTGSHASAARRRRESLRRDDQPYREALESKTLGALETFLEDFPGHQREDEVRQVLRDAPFLAALETGEEARIEAFLRDHPTHPRVGEARQALQALQEDLVALLDQDRVEVRASGKGLRYVGLELRRRVGYPIVVSVPVGTLFASYDRENQDMVAIDRRAVVLGTDAWTELSVPVVCADHGKGIPRAGDSFGLGRLDPHGELARILALAAEAETPFAAVQSAVWVVTDDISFYQLEQLTLMTGGTLIRLIDAYDAVWGMRLCADAGIDLTGKSIWNDLPDFREAFRAPGFDASLRRRTRCATDLGAWLEALQ